MCQRGHSLEKVVVVVVEEFRGLVVVEVVVAVVLRGLVIMILAPSSAPVPHRHPHLHPLLSASNREQIF